MRAFIQLLLSETPTPMPTMTVEPGLVTPGFPGFLAIGLLVVVVIVLLIDMLRRIRRAGYRSDVNAQLDAEAQQQAARAVEATDVDDQDIDPETDR